MLRYPIQFRANRPLALKTTRICSTRLRVCLTLGLEIPAIWIHTRLKESLYVIAMPIRLSGREESPALISSFASNTLIQIFGLPITDRFSVIWQHVRIHGAELMIVNRRWHSVGVQDCYRLAKRVLVFVRIYPQKLKVLSREAGNFERHQCDMIHEQ